MDDGTRAAREAGRDAIARSDQIGVPAIVFWEVGLLARRGRLELDVPAWTEAVLSIPRVRELPLTAAIAVAADRLSMHADPADRFVVASSLAAAAPLVTKDRLLRDLALVRTIW